jgi:drug/metabolite transporter (DMT)-like permease
LLLAALLWSLGGVLIKSIAWPPMAIAGARSAIAIPVMLLCIGRPRFSFSTAQIGGAIGYAATVALFVFATRMTTAANAIFLQYTAPIYVAIIGRWYLRERPLAIDWFVIAVALGGIALFFLDRLATSGFWGNIIALASGLAFASVAIFLRKEKAASPVTSIIPGNIIVAFAGLPFLFMRRLVAVMPGDCCCSAPCSWACRMFFTPLRSNMSPRWKRPSSHSSNRSSIRSGSWSRSANGLARGRSWAR